MRYDRHPAALTLHLSLCPPPGAGPLQRHNPRSDLFPMHKFDHVEFWCGDATTTSGRCAQCQGARELTGCSLLCVAYCSHRCNVPAPAGGILCQLAGLYH